MGPRWLRVGLTTLLVLVTLFLTLAAAAVTASLCVTVADSALSESELSAQQAVDSCFKTSKHAARQIAAELLYTGMDDAGLHALVYLRPAFGAVRSIQRFLQTAPPGALPDPSFWNTTLRALLYSTYLTAQGPAARTAGFGAATQGLSCAYTRLDAPVQGYYIAAHGQPGAHSGARRRSALRVLESGAPPFAAARSGSPDSAGRIAPGPCDPDPGSRSGACPADASSAATGRGRLTELIYHSGSTYGQFWTLPRTAAGDGGPVHMLFVAPIPQPGTGPDSTAAAAVWAQVSLATVSDFLRVLAGRMIARGRLYLSMSDTFTDRSGIFVGASHGEEQHAAPEDVHLKLIYSRDRVIRSHAQMVMGLANWTQPSGGTLILRGAFRVCANPAAELLVLPMSRSEQQCGEAVLRNPMCSLTFATRELGAPAAAEAACPFECACVAAGSTCRMAEVYDNVYRLTPTGYETLYALRGCRVGSNVRMLSAAAAAPECAALASADALCSAVFSVQQLQRAVMMCVCVVAGAECDPTPSHQQSGRAPPSVHEWTGVRRGPAPDLSPAATYDRHAALGKPQPVQVASESGGGSERWLSSVLRAGGSPASLGGLLLHVSGLVPELDLLSAAIASFERTNEQIAADAASTRDERNSAFRRTYIIVAAVTTVLLLAAAGLPHLVVAPLRDLQGDMALVAQMKTEQLCARELSAFAEVSRMQESFAVMTMCISLYKSYLPRSVLQELSDSDEDSLGAEAAEQEVASNAASSRAQTELQSENSRRLTGSAGSNSSRSSGSRSAERAATPATSVHSRASARSGLRRVPTDPIQRVKQKSVSLLLTNRLGFLSDVAKRSPEQVATAIAGSVEEFAADVQCSKGVVDLLSADHLSATFGAARPCTGNRSAAVQCAVGRGGAAQCALGATGAVCSGHALCGDFGSAVQRRFMVIGGVSSFVRVVERIAARGGIRLLVDKAVCSDIQTTWNLRAQYYVRYPKRGAPAPVSLWQPLALAVSDRNDEWMYNLENKEKNPWEAYNTAQLRWWQGDAAGACPILASADPGMSPEVAEACAKLLSDMSQAGSGVLEVADAQLDFVVRSTTAPSPAYQLATPAFDAHQGEAAAGSRDEP